MPLYVANYDETDLLENSGQRFRIANRSRHLLPNLVAVLIARGSLPVQVTLARAIAFIDPKAHDKILLNETPRRIGVPIVDELSLIQQNSASGLDSSTNGPDIGNHALQLYFKHS